MNKEDFLCTLRTKLSGLPQEDVERSLEFYREAIDDRIESGLAEEEAVSALGSPDGIAEQILADTPLQKKTAAAMGFFDTENRKGLPFDMKTFEAKEAFSDICVEDAECDVRILRAADDKCKVICPEKQDGSVYHTVTVCDGVLKVRRHDERKWYQRIGISFGIPDVEVYLPEKEYGRLSARSISGSIRVTDGFTFESASLESTSGSVQMLSQVKKELKAESTSDSVTIENASPERLAAKSISGRVVLSHIRSGDITARATSGKIELTDVLAEKSLYVRSVSGDVALDGCDGGTIKIEATSGSVKGSILSDKIFIAKSTSGSVKIPRSAPGGECQITTTSGSIAIEIRQ